MIGRIKGKVVLKKEKFLIVETNGVGYKINISLDTLSKIKKTGTNAEEVTFWTHTHVREDAFDLYGFSEYSELEFFEMLIGISGIGPKSALAILGITSIETLSKAISTGDTSYLTKVSGIGRKTAEKIVIELRDKISNKIDEKGESSLQGELDTLEALKSLGYSQNQAREALKKIPPDLNTNAKIKEALKILSGK
jgi:holliday junction DNA helicase RuvA